MACLVILFKKLYPYSESIGADEICPDCFKKYTGQKYRYIKYCDKNARIHLNIYERGIINQGK